MNERTDERTDTTPWQQLAGLLPVDLKTEIIMEIENTYSVAVYQNYLTRLGKLIIFEPWRENYQFSQPSPIFLIYGNTMYVFYLSFYV